MAAAAPSSTSEEIRKLQEQVDHLKERLDFISPMLPLVNFVQDYFQKVECEASLQLIRLKNAQVVPRDAGDDEVSNAQLETVKWIHFLTDTVTSLHGSVAASPARPPTAGFAGHGASPATPATLRDFGSVNSRASGGYGAGGDGASRASSGQYGSALEGASPGTPSGRATQPGLGAGSGGTSHLLLQGSADSPSQLVPPRSTLPPTSGYRMDSRAGESSGGSGGFLLGSKASMRQGGSVSSASPGGGSGGLECEPLAEPGTGGTNGDGDRLDGLVLGRGSWAAAYRQAHGARREALRLLCRSSIVTERELSDDLTVISQEHIDECVSIAQEMLQTWPLDVWARQPEEAKKFFEARLTALYQRKFGEQKG